jgi:hypothetical protein
MIPKTLTLYSGTYKTIGVRGLMEYFNPIPMIYFNTEDLLQEEYNDQDEWENDDRCSICGEILTLEENNTCTLCNKTYKI